MWSGMGDPRHDDEAEDLLRLMGEHQMELLLPPGLLLSMDREDKLQSTWSSAHRGFSKEGFFAA